MTTTLAQLKTKVIAKLGVQSDDGRLANLTTSINAGLQQMATEYDWPWLVQETTISTVAGTVGYTMPATATRVRSISFEDRELVSIQRSELVRYSQQSGLPSCYYVRNSTIKLAATPDDVYVLDVEYVAAENVLVSDSDTILCPDWYADLAAVYGALEEARLRRDTVLESLLDKSRLQWINRIKDNVLRTKDIASIVSRDDW